MRQQFETIINVSDHFQTGFCGIPPALVQRYAEELQHTITDVADALDQIRITSLQQQARRGVSEAILYKFFN